VAGDKRFVYVLKNADPEPQFYIGLTSNVAARVSHHSAGRCPHTAMRPMEAPRLHRVRGRGNRRPLRTLLEVRLWPRVCETALRTV